MPRKGGVQSNLVRNEDLTPEERSEKARRAQKASAKARRDKRDLRERLALLLQLPMVSNGVGVVSPITGKFMSVGEAIDTAVIKQALKGNIRAAETIYNLLAVKVTRTEVTGPGGKDLIPAKLDVSSLSDEQLKAIASIKVKEDNDP